MSIDRDGDSDVVIVGAGLSGLCAARSLEAAGRSVVVLEATERIGGKIRTEQIGEDHVDLGAHWIGPGQDRIAALALELGVRTEHQPLKGRQVMVLDGKRYVHRGLAPALSPLVLGDMGTGMLRAWRMHRGLGFSGSADDSRRRALDAMTVEQLERRLFRTRRARALFDMTLRLVLGAEASELSALHVLALIEAAGGLRRISSFKGGAQQDFFVGGAKQICERLAAQLRDPVALKSPVIAVEQDETNVTVRTEAASHRAQYAVLAVPLALAGRIAYSPALPPERVAFLQRTALGAYTKVVASYERPWWRDDGLNGIALATDGPVQMIVDGASGSSQGILVGFITGAPAHAFSELDAQERRASALDAFARLLGPRAARVTGYLDFAWSEQPWFRGAPVSFPSPGALSSLGDLPHQPVGRFHWAGSDLARKNTAYMDGAIESGERSAREILSRLA